MTTRRGLLALLFSLAVVGRTAKLPDWKWAHRPGSNVEILRVGESVDIKGMLRLTFENGYTGPGTGTYTFATIGPDREDAPDWPLYIKQLYVDAHTLVVEWQ